MKLAIRNASNRITNKGQSSPAKKFKSHTQDELKVSANATRKAKNHGQRVIAMLYCIGILAIGLSITLYCTSPHRTAENEQAFVWFFISMYLSSIVGMLYILFYVYRNRHASIEAIQKGNLSASRILFSMRGEPVSLYLRIGLCIFAIMAIVFSVCRAYEVTSVYKEFDGIITYTASKILFVIVQTIFLLLLHRLVFLANVRLFSFILLHLLTVNLCIWVESAIEKISHNMATEYTGGNITKVKQKYTIKATGYFLPAIPEYCAIAAAVIYEITQRIGQLKQLEADHEHSDASEEKHDDKKGYINVAIGIVISIIILVITLVLETTGKSIDQYRKIVHLSEISVIHIISLGLSFTGIAFVRKLKFSVNFAKNALDEKLLLVTFFLTVTFFAASIVLCIAYLSIGNVNSKMTAILAAHLTSILLELMQVIVQTYFIHDMFYRCCHHEVYQQTKPGRAVIIILSALNFSLWMIYSFQVKNNSILFKQNAEAVEASGLQGLTIFIRVVLPMVMLFRYHSSVCLAISVVRIYEDEVARYESMLRWVKQGTTREFLQKQSFDFRHIWETGESSLLNTTKDVQLSSEDPIEGKLTKLDGTPKQITSKSEGHGGRRNTEFTLEVARTRLAAIEENHRLTEQKLKQQRESERSLGKCSPSVKTKIPYPKNKDVESRATVDNSLIEENQLTSQRPRRDTKMNWEVARMRVAASEASHRNTEIRLKQQHLKGNGHLNDSDQKQTAPVVVDALATAL
ncbi:hypothetical protein P879_00980 [Paragonimus westermani]|uniref:Otopetrin n=1 Tax=Paragonimus westermani TaxID=34504 RepID=A0A8T0DRG6_9TREM|nr:hypothetical protein P879_00980 [Paragonimus westermani]